MWQSKWNYGLCHKQFHFHLCCHLIEFQNLFSLNKKITQFLLMNDTLHWVLIIAILIRLDFIIIKWSKWKFLFWKALLLNERCNRLMMHKSMKSVPYLNILNQFHWFYMQPDDCKSCIVIQILISFQLNKYSI